MLTQILELTEADDGKTHARVRLVNALYPTALTDSLPLSTQVHSISGGCMYCGRKNDHQAIYVREDMYPWASTCICS